MKRGQHEEQKGSEGIANDSASSSSRGSITEDTKDDHIIAQVLSEEPSDGDGEVRRRLARLNSIPHVPRINSSIPTCNDADLDHQTLLERLHEFGLQERKMTGDGNCQFRAISDQLYATPEKHKFVRKQVVQQLKEYKELYEGYVPMEYNDYVQKMRRLGEWGDHVTLQAAADHFGVRIGLVTSFKDTCYIEIIPKLSKQTSAFPNIYLSFWSEVHYNSLFLTSELPAVTQTKPKRNHWLF